MKKPEITPENELASAVQAALNCEGLLESLAEIYADLDAATGRRPCKACGACCDFETFGHRLYVSTAELAFLLNGPNTHSQTRRSGLCPWQIDNLCTARERRAIGCRVFNCCSDPDIDNELYESFHARVQELHSTYGIPYLYVYLPNAVASLVGL